MMQRLLSRWHAVEAAIWAAAGVYGWFAGWAQSIPFLYVASVYANVVAAAAALSGERPDEETLERLEELGERLARIEALLA